MEQKESAVERAATCTLSGVHAAFGFNTYILPRSPALLHRCLKKHKEKLVSLWRVMRAPWDWYHLHPFVITSVLTRFPLMNGAGVSQSLLQPDFQDLVLVCQGIPSWSHLSSSLQLGKFSGCTLGAGDVDPIYARRGVWSVGGLLAVTLAEKWINPHRCCWKQKTKFSELLQ